MALEKAQNSPEQQNLYKEELDGTEWLGEIVDVEDPLKLGRCKIKVYEKFDNLTNDLIPWAFPAYNYSFAGGESKGYGIFSYPKLGTKVRVRFNGGDFYAPEYYTIAEPNDKMKAEWENSYQNVQCLVFDEDEDLKIIYTQEKGLIIWSKQSYVNIDKNQHITIQHKDNPSEIKLVDGTVTITAKDQTHDKSPYIWLDADSKIDLGHSANYTAVLCENLKNLLDGLCTIIDAKVPSNTAASMLYKSFSQILCSNLVHLSQ